MNMMWPQDSTPEWERNYEANRHLDLLLLAWLAVA